MQENSMSLRVEHVAVNAQEHVVFLLLSIACSAHCGEHVLYYAFIIHA
jgi:hypothetical protein